MEKIHPNEPAFPVEGKDMETDLKSNGLTKREYFAAMAMQGYISTYSGDIQSPNNDHVAKWSVKQADALIVELNKSE